MRQCATAPQFLEPLQSDALRLCLLHINMPSYAKFSTVSIQETTFTPHLIIMGSIFSAIGRGINAIISAIANVFMTIVSAITTIIVTIFDVIMDIICCRCFGSRRTGRRTGRTRGFGGTGRIPNTLSWSANSPEWDPN
ncbi:hypothetical protein AB1N83_010911 [Pleurotus pulmonarius]